MRGLYGIANHNPHIVGSMLASLGVKAKMLGFGEEPGNADVYFIPSVTQFLRYREDLNRKKCKVFVFDAPVLLEYLTPIKVLDVGKKRASFLYTFIPLTKDALQAALDETDRVKVSHQIVEVIPTILNSVTTSALNPILNFLYSVSNTDSRLKYQGIIYEWIGSEATVKDLKSRIMKCMRKKAVTASLKALCDYFSTDAGASIRKAVAEITAVRSVKKPVNFKALYKKYHVEPFDVKYLMRAIRRQKNVRLHVDQDVQDLYQQRKAKVAVK